MIQVMKAPLELMMSNASSEHFLESKRPLAAITLAAFFTGMGVTMIDPRTGFGVLVCIVGVCVTMLLYFRELIVIRLHNWRRWPTFGIFLILFQIIAPIYVLVTKARADELTHTAIPAPAAGPTSNEQKGGQTGGTNNNYGPTYNGPFSVSPIKKSEVAGPVTVSNSNQCPRGWSIIESSIFERNGVGISAPIGAHICIVNNQFIENGVGYEMRPK